MMPDWSLWCWQMRRQLRMTQTEVAECCGVTRSTWCRWERGDQEPPAWRKEAVRDTLAMEAAAYLGAIAAVNRRREGPERD